MGDTITADYCYSSSINERHYTDLNSRVEEALKEKVGERYVGMDGGQWIQDDYDDPNAADNQPMVEVHSKEEAEELRLFIQEIVQRPVELSFMDDEEEGDDYNLEEISPGVFHYVKADS